MAAGARAHPLRTIRLLLLFTFPSCESQFIGVISHPPCIITEYCERGSLADVLRKAREGPPSDADLPWARRLEMAVGGARGMLLLHSSDPPILHK